MTKPTSHTTVRTVRYTAVNHIDKQKPFILCWHLFHVSHTPPKPNPTIECILGTKTADSGTVSILGYNPKKDRRSLFQNVGVQFQENDYQPEIKVSELCEETACLYKNPSDWKELCVGLGIESKINNAVKNLSGGERQ